MKKIRIKEAFSRRLCILFFTILISLFTTSMGGCISMVDDKDSISELSFSHDGKKVVFDRCKSDSCQIQVYGLETGELAAYQSPKNERWTMGKYSYDGKRIAFSVIPIKQKGGMELGDMQIAVMDADGKNFKKVTTGPGAKLYPTFSHNGKKILYARAAHIREQGRTPASQYDAWEVNLETGEQTQLTFFEYFYMGNLTYFPDDERFIYWGNMPSVYEGVRVMDVENFRNKMIELGKKGISISGIAVMKGKELTPSPYQSFPKDSFPQRPLLSKDGSVIIYEKSESGKYYLYSENRNHRLLDESGSISSATISPDGMILAIIPFSGLTLGVVNIKNGNVLYCVYLPGAPKKITNWSIPIKYKNIYKMIPAKPTLIINIQEKN